MLFSTAIKDFFVDSDLLYSKIFNLETKVINKIRVSAGYIFAQTSELSESPGQLLNILLDCPDTIKQLRELADEKHLENDGLTSLWSMNSNEIGSFHERVKPYRPIVFKYPIREGADLLPKGAKHVSYPLKLHRLRSK